MSKLRLAIIGCGAVTERVHLPALAICEDFHVTALIDSNLDRARSLAQKFNVSEAATDWRSVQPFDVAIVALPNHLHAPVSCELLAQKIHVLVEKPMAITATDCDQMIAVAQTSGAKIAVGLEFRQFRSSGFVKRMVESGILGQIETFDLRNGSTFDWPSVTDYQLRRASSGGGVLINRGIHLVDELLWWLGDYTHVDYFDDSLGGIETDCELHLRLESGATGFVELSRSRNLRNSCIIRGSQATLEAGGDAGKRFVRLSFNGSDLTLSGDVLRDNAGAETGQDLFLRQYADFSNAIRAGREPLVSGVEGRRTVALVERCYATRKPLQLPWTEWKSAVATV